MASPSINNHPVFVYATQFKNTGGDFASHPICVEQNVARLKEFGVGEARIHLIPDSSYLKKELISVKKAALILGGGALTALTSDLKEIRKSGLLNNAVQEGRINTWGQCAGAMICSDRTAFGDTIGISQPGFFSLLPIAANLDVFPIVTNAYDGGDNQKIVELKSLQGDLFSSYWNEGPKFQMIQSSAVHLNGEPKPISQYTHQAGIAEISGVYGRGKVLFSGPHLEVVSDIPKIKEAAKQLAEDKIRLRELAARYEHLEISKDSV